MLHPWLEPYFAQFVAALRQGRLPNSVIISGVEGLGGNELALAMAQYYLCHDPKEHGPCGVCRSCAAFKRLMHQDLKVAYTSTADEADNELDFTYDCSGLIARSEPTGASRRTMRIDTMRKITDFLNESPVLGGRGKVVIISGAESMLVGAANAILKTFEEPSPNSLILMVTKSLESLLPTILSRATKMVLRDVPTDQALGFLLNPANQQPVVIRRVDDEDGSAYLQEAEEARAKCPGLAQPITPPRAEIALALNSSAPLSAMRMLLDGTDLKAIAVVQQLINAIMGGDRFGNGVIQALKDLPKPLQGRLFSELILEILKYKAYVEVSQLPLIKYAGPNPEQTAQILMRLQCDHLFDAMDKLRYIEDRPPLIPARAPQAIVRAWLKAFSADLA